MSGNGAQATAKLFRGRSLADVLPRIREELGPDAVVLRHRDGLTGGVAGFFQRPCVELEAVAGPATGAVAGDAPEQRTAEFAPFVPEGLDQPEALPAPRGRLLDIYDDGRAVAPAVPPFQATVAEGLESPAMQAIMAQAAPFADHLDAALEQALPEQVLEPEPEPEPEPVPEPPSPPGTALAAPEPSFETALADLAPVAGGLSARLAAELLAEAVSHRVPFGSPRELKRYVREGLARRIAVGGWGASGRVVAFVGGPGAGKTDCTARLARAYAAGSDLDVVCIALRAPDRGAELLALLSGTGVPVHSAADGEDARRCVELAGRRALVVIDTPRVARGDGRGVAQLAADLEALGEDAEAHLALPVTLGGGPAGELLRRVEALAISHIALTHAGETGLLGAPLEIALRVRIPLSYVAADPGVDGGFTLADPLELAAHALP